MDRPVKPVITFCSTKFCSCLNDPGSVYIPLLTNNIIAVSLQESYNAGVKHYEADDFEAAIKYFEQALREYYNEDVACRALCEGPQRFEEYEYLGYKGGLYEAIAGKVWLCSLFAYSKMLWKLCKNILIIQCLLVNSVKSERFSCVYSTLSSAANFYS